GQAALHMLFRADPAPDGNTRAGITDLFGNLHEETLAVAPFSAVHVRAFIGERRQILMLEIAVRAVNLYSIEPADDCHLAAIGKFLLFAADFFYGHLSRHLPSHVV